MQHRKLLPVLVMNGTMLFGSGQAFSATETVLLDKIIAIVDDDIVMQSELQQRMKSISMRLRAQGTPLPAPAVMEQRVLDQLILESVQLQRAKRAGIRISDNQLNQTLRSIARSNQMTLEQFEAQLEREGETYASAREQIRREMIVARIQQREVDSPGARNRTGNRNLSGIPGGAYPKWCRILHRSYSDRRTRWRRAR